jgi:acetyl-CoA synthetase
MTGDFDVKLVEDVRYYTPDPHYKRNAWMGDYRKACNDFLANPDKFWIKTAQELALIRPLKKTKEWNYPYAKWFTNAQLNITANCLDRRVNDFRRNNVALIWKREGGANKSNVLEDAAKIKKYKEG